MLTLGDDQRMAPYDPQQFLHGYGHLPVVANELQAFHLRKIWEQ
jgi:hypothetical protein